MYVPGCRGGMGMGQGQAGMGQGDWAGAGTWGRVWPFDLYSQAGN